MTVIAIIAIVAGVAVIAMTLLWLARKERRLERWLPVVVLGLATAGLGLWLAITKK